MEKRQILISHRLSGVFDSDTQANDHSGPLALRHDGWCPGQAPEGMLLRHDIHGTVSVLMVMVGFS